MITLQGNKSFKDCLHLDYHLSQIMTSRDDFIDGVSEVLINKTYKQNWDPDSVKNIGNKINKYFKAVSSKKLNFDNWL